MFMYLESEYREIENFYQAFDELESTNARGVEILNGVVGNRWRWKMLVSILTECQYTLVL